MIGSSDHLIDKTGGNVDWIVLFASGANRAMIGSSINDRMIASDENKMIGSSVKISVVFSQHRKNAFFSIDAAFHPVLIIIVL